MQARKMTTSEHRMSKVTAGQTTLKGGDPAPPTPATPSLGNSSPDHCMRLPPMCKPRKQFTHAERGLLGEGCDTNSNSAGHQIQMSEQGASLVAQWVKNLPADAGDMASVPESRKTPPAAEQLSPYTTATEAASCNHRAHTP